MRLKFENELGTVEMSGGGDDSVRITGINGLGVPAYERRIYASYDFDGAVESMRRLPVRVITVGGDIIGGMSEAARITKILGMPCTMTVICDDFEREINVAACESQLEKKNKEYVKFALSLTCDDPYFYDSVPTEVGLYIREKLISADITLPAMFSKRTTNASVTVHSDREVEPVITILGKRNPDETEGKIVIENKITGTVFTLLYVPEEDELITIDIAKRTITSDINGNLISHISDDSFLSDLVIDDRGAEFVTTGYGATGHISAYIVYRNKYIEAIL
ncbi:MAG: hypothetical protein UIM24_05470 [Clostridia bacterium]|nr:hypothetical protein [Clostridia bacterium]